MSYFMVTVVMAARILADGEKWVPGFSMLTIMVVIVKLKFTSSRRVHVTMIMQVKFAHVSIQALNVKVQIC